MMLEKNWRSLESKSAHGLDGADEREMLGFKGLSFDTISSTGANAGELRLWSGLTS
jgi:hypothetical protein